MKRPETLLPRSAGSGVLSKVTSDSAKASINSYRGVLASVDAQTEKYSAPKQVDYASYQGKVASVVKGGDGKPVSVVDVLRAIEEDFQGAGKDGNMSLDDLKALHKDTQGRLASEKVRPSETRRAKSKLSLSFVFLCS